MVIKLTRNTPRFKKGSARAKWFTAIRRYNGKDGQAFLDATTKKPPVFPKSGNAESTMGWLRYFEREEIIQITEKQRVEYPAVGVRLGPCPLCFCGFDAV